MAKIFIETETLGGIANAIRSKTGSTEPIKTTEMAAQIEGISVGSAAVVQELSITSNGTYRAPEGIDGYTPITVNVPTGSGGPTAEDLTFTGSLSGLFSSPKWNWMIEKYGNQMTFTDITSLEGMFSGNTTIEDLSAFTIDVKNENVGGAPNLFYNCNDLKYLPKLINFKPNRLLNMFYGAYDLREIPESFYKDWNYEGLSSLARAYNYCFHDCRSLRHLPGFVEKLVAAVSNSSSLFYYGFDNCHVLEEALNLPVASTSAFTSNQFNTTFNNCARLKRITFQTNEDGTPVAVKWKSQTINLSFGNGVGAASSASQITGYNSGITTDTRIYDDASYQALKDNPDAWTTNNTDYSRYNKISAIETINSLPDTSAYLATQSSGTNTIKFKGAAGAKTDGGAINTMTEEEIAIATAKGWTVSFA